MRRWLVLIALALLGGWFVRTYMYEAIYAATGSMEPTLPVGMHYLVNRWIYRFNPPRHGDIIVFRSPVDPEMGLIKRVIGVGGDTVEIRDKQVYLNGQLLSEPYAIHKRPLARLEGDDIPPIVVPPDHVFVLGDDRDESEDSSDWKGKSGQPIYFVSDDEIEGKLIKP